MGEETETGTQTLDSSSETFELRLGQEPTTDETSTDDHILRLLDERIKQATDPILRRIEELCALRASRNETESAGNSEASVSRCNRETFSPSCNRYDKYCS